MLAAHPVMERDGPHATVGEEQATAHDAWLAKPQDPSDARGVVAGPKRGVFTRWSVRVHGERRSRRSGQHETTVAT